jgi:hypothetical protein
MKNGKRKRSSRVGLVNGCINWIDPVNTIVSKLAVKGLYGRVIAKCTGLTVGQVYSRCKYLGISLTKYRSGESAEARVIVKQYDLVHGLVTEKDLEYAKRFTESKLKDQGYTLE